MAFTKKAVQEITKVAKRIGVEPAALLAVAEVESNGTVFWDINGHKLAPIRFEGHYFHQQLSKRKSKKKLKQAVRAGLAHPRAGRVKNPRSQAGRYKMFKRAWDIDRAAAIESISWGFPQVMGRNWKDFGYKDAFEVEQLAQSGVAGQVELMVMFIVVNKLRKHLRSKNWAKFARAYNGPGYKKNRYHTKMAAAYKRWVKAGHGGVAKPPKRDANLKETQEWLKRLGYKPGPVDGIMGRRTRAAVKAFQRDQGLVVDGKPGPLTREALQEALLID